MNIFRYIRDQFTACGICGTVGGTIWVKYLTGADRDFLGRKKDFWCYLCSDHITKFGYDKPSE